MFFHCIPHFEIKSQDNRWLAHKSEAHTEGGASPGTSYIRGGTDVSDFNLMELISLTSDWSQKFRFDLWRCTSIFFKYLICKDVSPNLRKKHYSSLGPEHTNTQIASVNRTSAIKPCLIWTYRGSIASSSYLVNIEPADALIKQRTSESQSTGDNSDFAQTNSLAPPCEILL